MVLSLEITEMRVIIHTKFGQFKKITTVSVV